MVFSRASTTLNKTGQIPKRSNGADCKSAGYAFLGSNPSLPTKEENILFYISAVHLCRNSSAVEQLFCKQQVAGSNPVSGSKPYTGFEP